MKLTELEPQWMEHDGRRIGFVFISPCQRTREDGSNSPTPYRLTCMAEPTKMVVQREVAERMFGDDDYTIVPCKQEIGWSVAGGIEHATFESLSVTPSIDGSASGHWHGFITNGDVV